MNNIMIWVTASGIRDAIISIPVAEIVLLLGLLTICLLLRLSRTGLIIAYVFTYRWGWSFCLGNSFPDPHMRFMFLTGYIVFGIIVLTLAVVAMLVANRSSSGE